MSNVQKEIEELSVAFYNFDLDKSGTITVEDLRWIVVGKGAKMSYEEADEFLAEIDFNQNGVIDYHAVSEFLVSTSNSD